MQVRERSAIFDFRGSSLDRCSAYLSPEESSWLSSFQNRERRRQSLNARLCLKHLFLLQMSSSISDRIVRISEEELNRFPEWLYREISLVPGEPHLGKRRFTWCGTNFPGIHVSLSHSQTICGASLAMGRRVGVDIEFIEQRSDRFYLNYFSPAEREWVEANSGTIHSAWLFTILWSLKECALKTAIGTPAFSDLAAIEIARFPEQENLGEIYKSRAFQLDPVQFAMDVRGPAGIDSLDCELTGNPEQIVIVARKTLCEEDKRLWQQQL